VLFNHPATLDEISAFQSHPDYNASGNLDGLFATSSEPVILEFDVMEKGLLKRYRGKAHVIGSPTVHRD
jgi:hypothetical protein